MTFTPLSIWCSAFTILVVGVAVITDLRSRRIPNLLTFSAFCLAVVIRTALQGWIGFGIALSGAVLAMGLLLLLHAGKGIGMGDLKLAGAVGAFVGPIVAVVAMFASAIAGGILAIAWMLRPGGMLAPVASTFLIGLPFVKGKKTKEQSEEILEDCQLSSKSEHLPYGLAIGVGSVVTLAVCWWTGNEEWFLTFIANL
jgi:prepilin peptidase CpaA